ncbi:MAG: hypothetical protein JJE51_05410 [Thermoanaerobaculia bacterium]|nr:hypothetical protein [Thermoanaerobaculia bacterium]
MKRALVLFLFLAFPLAADDCAELTHLGALYELRALMMKTYTSSYDINRFVDRKVDDLREPLGDGDYRWVRWVRPSGDGPVDKEGHTVLAVHERETPDVFEATGTRVFSVRIAVPRKRSLLKDNKPIYVGDVTITADGEQKEHTIGRWMNPDTSQTFDLSGIARRVAVRIEAATSSRNRREALVEVQMLQALTEDDPANPNYGAIRSLKRIREEAGSTVVDAEIASLERHLFPAGESIPILTLIADLRRADQLIRSEKVEDQDKGNRLLKETFARLR